MEAKLYKAIDGLEAVIQHNASDLSTWIPLEYTLNKTYADDKVAFSDYLVALRQAVGRTPLRKLGESSERLCPEEDTASEEAAGRCAGGLWFGWMFSKKDTEI